jgi:hypothetical protein
MSEHGIARKPQGRARIDLPTDITHDVHELSNPRWRFTAGRVEEPVWVVRRHEVSVSVSS